MTTFKRGEVVLVCFPHADLQSVSWRPALVVQSEQVRTELGHYLLAQITTTPRHGPTRLPVAADSPDGLAMGLRADSVIVLDVMQATEARLIRHSIGRYPQMERVSAILRELLAL